MGAPQDHNGTMRHFAGKSANLYRLSEGEDEYTDRGRVAMKAMTSIFCALAVVFGLSIPACAKLVDMRDGTVYDTDTQLSWQKDAAAGGLKTWDEAVAWAASLNEKGGFAHLTGWRLPAADPACGDNSSCADGEMGHLYYFDLGNASHGNSTNNDAPVKTGPFANLETSRDKEYWLSAEAASACPGCAWSYNFYFPAARAALKSSRNFAWAVRCGARSLN